MTTINNYQCIADEEEVKRFATMILGSLGDDKKDFVLLVQPIARWKYNETMSTGSIKLYNTIVRNFN